MINIKELNGNKLKKSLGIEKAAFRWHNKNKSGGNFGINLYNIFGKNYELTGRYNKDGQIFSLCFGYIHRGLTKLDSRTTYEDLITIIKRITESEQLAS